MGKISDFGATGTLYYKNKNITGGVCYGYLSFYSRVSQYFYPKTLLHIYIQLNLSYQVSQCMHISI